MKNVEEIPHFFPFYFLCNLPIDKQNISWYNWAGRPRAMRPELR